MKETDHDRHHTAQHRTAARPPPGGYPVPGAIGALAAVDVTVLDLPTAVNEADVERRLLAFQERLRVPARARLLERLRTDGRLAMKTFRDWIVRDGHDPAAHRLRSVIGERRRRGDRAGNLMDDLYGLYEEDAIFAWLVERIESRPLVTSADRSRIRRRALAYARRRDAVTVDVEGRLLAFLERLRASARARLLERLPTDGRLAVETFRDWMVQEGRTPFARQLRQAIGERRRRGGPPMDGDLPEDDGDPAGLLDDLMDDLEDDLDDGDDPAPLPEADDDLFARLVERIESRPLVTSTDRIRIGRRPTPNAATTSSTGRWGTRARTARCSVA